ncbi:MAG: glycosyltransferase, partial [Pseudomonadota bacterium]
ADYFTQHPDIDVVYGNRILIDSQDQVIGEWILPKHTNHILSWVDYVPQETLFWRRKIWDAAGGGIDETFHFAMDWDLLIRFKNAGARFAHVPRFLGCFRVHDEQKTNQHIARVGTEEMRRLRVREHKYEPSIISIYKATAPYLMRHKIVDWTWRIKETIGLHD